MVPERTLPGEGYSIRTRKAIDYYQSGRGIEQYAHLFGFKHFRDLLIQLPRHAAILDIGSGLGTFAKELHIKRPDVITINLNPALSVDSFRVDQKKHWLENNRCGINIFKRRKIYKAQNVHDRFSVAALNPMLPFPDASLDVILDSMSSVYYSYDDSREKLMIGEIIRVLKPGGFAAVGVMWAKQTEELEKYLKSVRGITSRLRGINDPVIDSSAAFLINKE